MANKKKIINLLLLARTAIDQALDIANNGDDLVALECLKKARNYLKRADFLIIKSHLSQCIPDIFGNQTSEIAIGEILKTYHYLPS